MASVISATAHVQPSACLRLNEVPPHPPMTVAAVQAPDAMPEWARWLEEIGFIPGESVMLLTRGVPGGDPLMVRVGTSTFALRRAEAACVLLEPRP